MTKQPVNPERYDEEWITSAWGDEGGRHLLESSQLQPRPRVARAIELCNLKPGQSLLDIACGRGEVPAIAAERGVYATGLDFSTAVLKVARQVMESKQSQFPHGGSMALVQADATRLPFASNSMDRITMLDIIEHLLPDQLEMMFMEVQRLLKPDGFAVIHTLPNRWVYDVGYHFVSRLLRRLPADPRGPIEKQIHVNEQDLPKLDKMLRQSGLKSRIWLEQHMPAQARWQSHNNQYGDHRDNVYPVLAGSIGRLLELISHTPLKLLVCNDIFGILWKSDKRPATRRLPLALTERIVCCMSSKHKN